MLGGRAGLSPVMVGRTEALTQLADLLESISGSCGDGPAIGLISGEAGIGKSRLVRELLATTTSPQVLVAAAEPGELGAPYWLIRRLLGNVNPLPIAADIDSAYTAAVAALGSGASIVVVEDLHWVDAESVAVIDRLAQLSRSDVAIIATYRPEDLHRRLPGSELLLRLERRQEVERIHLRRLSRPEVGLLLGSIFGSTPNSSVVEAIYDRTGGNPFVIEELARCCGDSRPDDLITVALPWSLNEAVKARLDGLGPQERRLIETAAICGPSSSFDLLAAVAGLNETELVEVLRSLVARDLLIELADDEFGFQHALVRDAVSSQLLGRERRMMHQRAFEALEGSSDLAARARHASGAGQFDLFVDLARRAATDALRKGLSFEALRLADSALHEEPDDLQLLAIAAEAGWLVGAYAETRVVAERWLSVARASADRSAEADAVRWLARIAFEENDHRAAGEYGARLDAVVDELPEGLARARAVAGVAQGHMLYHRPELAIEWAERAILEATAVEAPTTVAQARIELASARGMLDDVDLSEALDGLLDAVAHAESIGEWTLATRGLNNSFDLIVAQSPQGRALIERFRANARRAGYDLMSNALVALREVEISFGESDQAALRRTLARAGEWWRDRERKAGWHRIMRFELDLEEGQLDRAREGLSALRGLDTSAVEPDCAVLRPDEHMFGRWQVHASLRLDVRSGVRLDPVVLDSISPHTDKRSVWLHRDTFELVEALLSGGVSPLAVQEFVEDRLFANAPKNYRVVQPTVAALVAAAAGRHREAIALLTDLVDQPDPSLNRHLIGHLKTTLAASLLAESDRVAALARLDDVLANEFSRWPGWRRDRAEALRRRIVVREASDGELTTREREVAALLAEGLTNSQVARRLFISPKTAAVHVSNILMKLRMSSRAEVAAWVVRSGLIEPGDSVA